VARAAQRRLQLDLIYFVPCGRPPHKDRPTLSPFLHRYAMVSLACTGERGLLPSLLEAGPDLGGQRRCYSIDTVRRVRQAVGKEAELYFLLGADAFLYLNEWKSYRGLLGLCNFAVASRPRFDWKRASRKFVKAWNNGKAKASQTEIQLPDSTIHYLPGVQVNVSSSEVRRRAGRGESLGGWVPRLVEGYIEKMGLYRRK